MLKKFLKEVVGIVLGKQYCDISDLLIGKKHTNEFLIAKKLEITINQTRNLLYRLSDQGLVSSIRKKDKKKGWYTYFWKLEILKSLEFLKLIYENKMHQFESQIRSRETKQFYICKTCNIELNEENALLNDFTCNECGGVFSLKDNAKLIREMKKNVIKMNDEVCLINEELKKEGEKEEKIKQKDIALRKAEAKAKRAKTRAASLKAKGKVAKKKVVKKKASKKKMAKKKVVKKKVMPKSKKKVVKKVAKKKVVKKKISVKGKKKVVKKVAKKMLTIGKKILAKGKKKK